jgi:hypothetical protein
MDEAQAVRRELKEREAGGEITFEERKQLEQQIDDRNAEAAFYFDDYGRVVTTDNMNDLSEEVSPILAEIGLGDLTLESRWMIVRESLARIWAYLTNLEKKMILQHYVHRQSIEDMKEAFGSAVGTRLSKIKVKCRAIINDQEGKYNDNTKIEQSFMDIDFQRLLHFVGYSDDNL